MPDPKLDWPWDCPQFRAGAVAFSVSKPQTLEQRLHAFLSQPQMTRKSLKNNPCHTRGSTPEPKNP